MSSPGDHRPDPGVLTLQEEVRLLWREKQPSKDVNRDKIYRDFQRQCEAVVWRIPPQEREDVLSEAILDSVETLSSPDVPLDQAVLVLYKALRRRGAQSQRRLRRSRGHLPWDEFAEALVEIKAAQSGEESSLEHYQALEGKALTLIGKLRPYLLKALDSSRSNDRGLLLKTYELQSDPHVELPPRSRNAHNVALHRARTRFTRILRTTLVNALPTVSEEERRFLEQILEIIDNGRLLHLLEFGSGYQPG